MIWLFGLYGCAQTVEGTTVAEAEAESEEETTDAVEQEKQAADSPAPPEKEGFVLHNSQEETDVFISLADCVCEYESEDFQIYKYLSDDGTAIYMRTGEKKATPHEKKIYDEEKEKEIFEACDKAFTEKDAGNWLELSDLNNWRELLDWENRQGYKSEYLWMRVDINGDNLPELIDSEAPEI